MLPSFSPPLIGGLIAAVPTLRESLKDLWQSSDLSSLSEGDSVIAWTGVNGNIMLPLASPSPVFKSGGMNGKPVVFFDRLLPSNPLICSNALFSGAQSAFSMMLVVQVSYWNSMSSLPLACIGTYNPPNSGEAYGRNCAGLVWNSTTAANPGLSFILSQNNDFGGGTLAAKHRIPFSRECVLILTYDGATSKLWVDGICVAADTSATGSKTINGGVAIGPLYTSDTNRALVSVGFSEIGTWSRALNNSECRAASSFLMGEFLSTENQMVCFLGDSIYEGTGASANQTPLDLCIPKVLAGYFENCARGGKSMAVQSSAAQPYPTMYSSFRRGQVAILGPDAIGITNLTNPATCLAQTVMVVNALHAQGAIVIVPPMIDNKSTINQATSNANRLTYNTAILNGETSADFTVPALASVPELYADGAHADEAYFLDGTHPTLLGYQLLAATLAPVIKTSLGV